MYLHQYFTTPEMVGGTRSYEMARRLVAEGHHVTMITSDRQTAPSWTRWRVTDEAGIEVHWAPVPYSNNMRAMRRIVAFLTFAARATWRAARTPCDVVYATSTPLTIAIPGRVAAFTQHAPFVLEVRDLWPDVPIRLGVIRNPVFVGMAHLLERWAYRGAKEIVALAPGMKQAIAEKGYDPDHIEVIPNGSDIELFRNCNDAAARVRSEHPWLQDRPLVVYAGALGLVNGVGWLARLAAVTRELDPEIRFAVLGEGRESEAVRELAHRLGVLEENFFMLGGVPKREAAHWVRAATIDITLTIDRDYLWQNSVHNKFFDALAAGRPVLTNHPGFQTDVALEAGAGEMLDGNDFATAAARLVALVRDEEWCSAAGAAAARLAEERFSRDLLASQLEQVLESAIGTT